MLHFQEKGRQLWDKVQSLLIDPVEQRVCCDEFLSEEHFPVCGINALAHYTMLNPDSGKMIMMSAKKLRELTSSGALVRPNEYDGEVLIEAWKYPSVVIKKESPNWVDKLSLALSLRGDSDPRVEGEVERLLDEMVWKD